MLETIREFALVRLEAGGEERMVRVRHFMWVLDLAEEARVHFYAGTGQSFWLERMAAERDSIRSALTCAFDSGETLMASTLAGTLWGYWFSTDNVREGSAWLQRALLWIDTLPLQPTMMVLAGSGYLLASTARIRDRDRVSRPLARNRRGC